MTKKFITKLYAEEEVLDIDREKFIERFRELINLVFDREITRKILIVKKVVMDKKYQKNRIKLETIKLIEMRDEILGSLNACSLSKRKCGEV